MVIKSFGWKIDTIGGKKYYRVVTTHLGIKDFKTEKMARKFMSRYKSKYGMV
jgi:hypothetical protein|tara:strand:+ start:80 stop:235 length:156 start_codon:yes stop_codon:yes gene_type:complete